MVLYEGKCECPITWVVDDLGVFENIENIILTINLSLIRLLKINDNAILCNALKGNLTGYGSFITLSMKSK